MKKRSLQERALELLAQREHSVTELRSKLTKATFDADEIHELINKLTQSGLQSDQRFTENYLRYRSQRGFGSQKIIAELKQRGVKNELIQRTLNQQQIDWFALAITVRCKRFGRENTNRV